MKIINKLNKLFLNESQAPKVVFKKNPSSGICYVKLHIDSGSSSEVEAHNYGIAHFLEHMIFKGTESMDSRTLSRNLYKLGRGNAYTYFDGTAYHLTCLKENWKESLKLLTEMVFNPTLPEKEFQMEKGVILEEFQMYASDINVQRQWNEFYSLFGEKAHPVIGNPDSIQNMDHSELKKFHKNHYTLDNTVFCVAGDIDQNEVMEAIKECSGKVPVTESLKVKHEDEGVNLDPVNIDAKGIKQGSLTMYFDLGKLSEFKNRLAVADLHQTILGGGGQSMLFESNDSVLNNKSGFLSESLREENGLCYSVHAGHYGFFDRSVSIISTALNPENIGKAIDLTLNTIKGMGDFMTKDTFETSKNTALFKVREMAENSASLLTYSDYHSECGDIDVVELGEQIKKVTKEDVVAFNEEYFKNASFKICTMNGKQ